MEQPEEDEVAEQAAEGVADQADTRLSRRPLTEPHPARLAPEHPGRARILAAHAAALAAGQAGYADPATGLFVFTAAALAATRKCCRSGCRHCPYLPLHGEIKVAGIRSGTEPGTEPGDAGS